jgi:pilus assembly protein CpaB
MVLVAARDLYPGVAITEDDLVAVSIPPRFLPSGVFLTPDHVIGQRPRERVLANEFLRASRLADPESGAGLHVIIPRDMRALSVEIGDGAALSGFLEPGHHVDVLVTIGGVEDDDGRILEAPTTHTLLQGIFVLAVNNRAQGTAADQAKRASRDTATLLVTPQQAEALAHAERTGALRLALRNVTDLALVDSAGFGLHDLFGAKEEPRRRPTVPARVQPVAPTVEPVDCTIVVVEGDERQVVPCGAD